jgi:multidrug efflux pump subunit AcrA (membrane-fusion protein)
MKSDIFLTVLVICALLAVPILGMRLLNAWAQATAQAELARGQAAALVVQAQGQAQLLQAQADITQAAADAVRSDTRAAHGLPDIAIVAITFLVCCVAIVIVWLVIVLHRTRVALQQIQEARNV